jgi:hypothetical protein
MILRIARDSGNVPDIRAADLLPPPGATPPSDELTIGLSPPGGALVSRYEMGLRDGSLLLGVGWESQGLLSTSSHYLDFLLAKKLLLIRYYLYGDFAEGASAPSRLSASAGLASLVRIVDVSGGRPIEDPSPSTTPTRTTDLGQARVLWFVVPLVPMALALAGLGTAGRWLSAALNLWMVMVLALVVLIVLYTQGMGSIWYSMAEFLVPTLFSAGLGCCIAGAFAIHS